MREIKFRAKHYGSERYKNNEWLFGMLLKGDKFYFIQDEYGITNYADENTIGQYIDLVDADGQRIYEGDVVQHSYKCCDETDRYLVQWDDEDLRFCFENTSKKGTFMALEDFYDDYNGDYAIRVIGNIHDNPELWEEG